MSRLNRRRQAAARRKVYVWRNDWRGGQGHDVFVDAEWALGPRDLTLTKREAIHLAYAISVSKKQRIEVTR